MRKLAASCLFVAFVGCAVSRVPTDPGASQPGDGVTAKLDGMIAAYQAALVHGVTTDFTTSRVVGDANTPDYRVQAYLKSLEPRPQITCNDTQSFNVATGGPIHTTPATYSSWTSCANTDIVALAIDSTSSTRGIASTSVSPNDGSAAASGLVVLTNIHSGGLPQLQSFAPTSLLPATQTFNLGGLLFNLTGTVVYALSTQGNLYCFNIPATTTPATAMTACSGSWPAAAATASITYSTAFPVYGSPDIEHIYFGDDGDHINCVQGLAGSSPGAACWSAPNIIAGGDNNEQVGPVVVNIDSVTGYETIYAGDNGGRFFRITNNGSAPATGTTIERSDLCTLVGQSSPCSGVPWGVHGSPTIDFTSDNAFVTAAGYMFQFPLTKEQTGGSSWGGGTTTYKNLNTLETTSTTVDGSTSLDHTNGYAYVGFAGYLFKVAYPFDGNLTDKIYDTQLTETVSGSLNYPIGYPLPYSAYSSIYIGTGTNTGTTGRMEAYTLNGTGASPPLSGISSTSYGAMVESGAVLDWENGNIYYGYDTGPGTSGGLVQYPAGNPNPSSAWGCPTGETLSGGVCVAGCIGNDTSNNCTLGPNVTAENCSGGVCSVQSCVTNYADCDGQNADGCEVDIKTNPNNCGACAALGGTVCPTTNDTPACVNGSCSVTCTSGYGICAPGNVNTSGCPTAISCTSCCGTGPGGSNTCGGGTACIGGSCASTTQAVCGSEDEDYSGTNPVVVTCPEGETIQAISFMSFGTPNGSCGSWSKGTCDDSNGSTGNNNEGLIASDACYGQTTCSIDPSNSIFGDPCSGTYKKMAIQVQCACAPVLSLCGNGYQDGDETDVDCGGGAETGCTNSGNIPTACATGKKCSQNSDCQSDVCTSGICGSAAPPSPIAYYPLTEQTGTSTADATGNGHTGTLNSTTWAGTGEGVTFSGAQTSYIQADGFTSMATSASFTLALWVKPTTAAGILVNVSSLASGSPGWCTPFIGFNSSGQVVAQVWTGSDTPATSPSALPTGSWSHIAMTYSSGSPGTIDLYINGTLVATASATYTASGAGSPADYLDWGANQTGNACALGTITNAAYSGGMDLMYVYNTALTASQVSTLAATGPTGSCTTTIACATNVGTGSTATVTCPAGSTIEAIEFASFGTPSGTCGSFSTGSCDDSNNSSGNNEEREIASAACYGLNSCNISVSTSTFGDPCTGTTKYLDVQAECGCAPIAAQCANGYEDGNETDVDCGGGTCGRCATGKKCQVNSDCTSNDCSSGICTSFPTAVASYALSEQSGTTTADGTGNGHTGTLNDEGSTSSTLEWAGSGEGITFPGSESAYMQASGFSSMATSGDPFTLTLWVKPTAAAGILVNVASQANGSPGWCTPFLGFNSSGEIVGQVWNGSTDIAVTGPAVSTGTWSHVALTYSTTDGIILYVNGSKVGQTAVTYTASGAASPADYLDWGANQTGGSTCATGTITNAAYSGGMDLMYVYNVELTAAQVSSLSAEAPAGVCTASIACAEAITNGNSATVTCPLGSTIEAVEFVSYGNPSGACGTFATGSCDASPQERAIASAACYGQSSCTIPVSQAEFSTPACSSSSSYLDIQVECGCAPIASQCANGYEDGSETDVDCGGGSCQRCGTGKKCILNSDCQSNSCSSGTCATFPSAVATYALEEQSGTTSADGTGNGHTATLDGTTAWAGAGDGVTLQGVTGSYVQASGFTDLANSGTAFTLTLWAKPVSSAGVLLNVSQNAAGNGWCTPFLGFNSSHEVVGQIWNGSADVQATAPSALPTGAWAHIALAYSTSDDTLRLYVDGTQVATATVTYNASGAGSPADFIEWGSNLGQSCAQGTITPGDYQGGMDYMAVYNIELTAPEIAALAAQAPTGAACTAGSQCYSGVCEGTDVCE